MTLWHAILLKEQRRRLADWRIAKRNRRGVGKAWRAYRDATTELLKAELGA